MHEPKCEQIGKLTGGKWERLHDISRRVYGINGLSPTIHTAGGGQQELKIIVPEATKKGYDVATYGDSINTAFPNSKTRRGRVGHGVAQTLTTSDVQQVVVEPMAYDEQNGRLRTDGTVGTLTTDGSSPKHNNRIIEPLVRDGFNQQVRADSSVCGTITRNVGADLKRNGQGIIELSDYRFYQQAIETLQENDCEQGDTIDAYNKRVNKDGVSPTITTRPDGFKTAILPVVTDDEESVVWNNDLGCFVDAKTGEMIVGEHDDYPEPQKPNCRIRKLTPRECFRLMGVKREDYEAVAKRQSDSSQYHLAGDSIVTAYLMVILGVLLSLDYNTKITELTEELLDADETNS